MPTGLSELVPREGFLCGVQGGPEGRSRGRLGGLASLRVPLPFRPAKTTPVGSREQVGEGAAFTRGKVTGPSTAAYTMSMRVSCARSHKFHQAS
jgi:hypothetical protein